LCRRIFASAGDDINIEPNVFVADGRDVAIGSHSGLGAGCRVYGATIGDNVMVAPGVVFLKQNHNYSAAGVPVGRQGDRDVAAPVIEDEVWIGERVIVLPGRRIGRGAIVGAGAVITRDVSPSQIVGGNPARVIGSRGEMPPCA
jgi:maltose O-acetyltransferase